MTTTLPSMTTLRALKALTASRALVSLRELRASLAGMTRAEQDAAISELEAAGLVALHYADDAGMYSAAELAQCIVRTDWTGRKTVFHAIARRRLVA